MNRISQPLLSILVLSLGILLSACEMSYFAADVQASEVCVVDMTVSFPAVPPVVGMSDVTTQLETTIGEDDLGIQLSDELELDVGVLSVALAPLTGVADLAFVEEIAVTVGAEESDIPSTLVVQLTASDRIGNGGLYSEPEEAVDVTAHIRAGELVMDFDLSGELPDQAWEANIDLCLAADAGYVAPL